MAKAKRKPAAKTSIAPVVTPAKPAPVAVYAVTAKGKAYVPRPSKNHHSGNWAAITLACSKGPQTKAALQALATPPNCQANQGPYVTYAIKMLWLQPVSTTS